MKSLGICIGASTLTAAIISENGKIERSLIKPHESNPRQAFSSIIHDIGCSDIDYGYITGRKFRKNINLPSIAETQAVESTLNLLRTNGSIENDYGAIVSLGAENFVLYLLDSEQNICAVETGNKCASGTGEFFLQQIRRMNLSVEDAVLYAKEAQPYKVSGRCSVFCKSDCTHALNKGIPASRVTAGLCEMIAEKVLELLEKSRTGKIIAVGGLTRIDAIMGLIRKNGYSLYIPECALIFEAVGAAWAAAGEKRRFFSSVDYYVSSRRSFSTHPPLLTQEQKVTFETMDTSCAKTGDKLIIGLDVGSTTTKAVALRYSDNAIVAKTYLRTNGNPVEASRECYRNIASQLPAHVSICGLGTTGSGRHIAGLHAGTSFIINEIIAHATASSYFDPEVDTIFEIGGQDAKYTHFTNGVPSDYAMNEACSAGTGSFLEEAAKESLNIDYRKIQDYALSSKNPPDFSDQCATFISSDIKTASHEGIGREDIMAGLVYSICMNYVNRVKGQRPVGKKVFMQGGVCYNRAVPLAMASIIGVPVIVPPEPGLMGAFGVALEVSRRLKDGEEQVNRYDLHTLALREVSYGKTFICKGGKEKCDRKCEISMLRIEGKSFPFGGACNRYYNLIARKGIDPVEYDFVRFRKETIFSHEKNIVSQGLTIGINNSFLLHSLYPLYSSFFTGLGLQVILPDRIDPLGIKRKRGSFCFPGEISHGAFFNLIQKNPDYLFMPSIIELPAEQGTVPKREHQCTCMLLQSEPYFLKSAFREIKPQIIDPVLDFSRGYESQVEEFIKIGNHLGFSTSKSKTVYLDAVHGMKEKMKLLSKEGMKVLSELRMRTGSFGIVLFGRSYNAFTSDANMGVPEKFASRGIPIIPWEMLSFQNQNTGLDINWAIGRDLMKAALFTAKETCLYGVYISNFSCGPDSFLLGYFREIMGEKPSLTLEIDSHTADAGINTRIDAFLDIIGRYRNLPVKTETAEKFTPAKLESRRKKLFFICSTGKKHSIYDPSVHLLLPSMGRLTSELMAASFEGAGIRSSAVPVYDQQTLKTGRANTSCKECLPLILTTGGLLKHLQSRKDEDEMVLYFMPTCWGNCRFTQYRVFLNKMINRKRIPDVALVSLSNENGYAGLKLSDSLNVLKSIIISDCMEDIRNAIRVLASDRVSAEKVFEEQWKRIQMVFRERKTGCLYKVVENVAYELSLIPLRYPLSQARTVSLMGEIFVRRDDFSCRELIDKLAASDIVVRRAPVLEWISYCDFNVKNRIYEARFNLSRFLEFQLRTQIQNRYETKIKQIFARSGLYHFDKIDLKTAIDYGKTFFSVRFTGEAILVAGNFFKDILHSIHGAISVGPFSCMPTRITEAVMAPNTDNKTRQKITGDCSKNEISTLPFLSVEIDGCPLSQTLETRIEAFCLQVDRIYNRLRKSKASVAS